MSCLNQDQVNIDQVNLGGDVSIENVLSGNASSAAKKANEVRRSGGSARKVAGREAKRTRRTGNLIRSPTVTVTDA